MDILTTVIVLIPSVLSLCVSGIYAYIALKKAKEPPKDEIWETATKLLCASGSAADADEFAELYEQLKLFKDNGCSMQGFNSLMFAINEKHRKEAQQSAKDPEPQL